MEARYITSAQKPGQLPEETLPEVAFIGRSNCGKSSLLNALVNRKNLARHSRTPGRTQMVNFFTWGPDLFLVDLPGYGFHQASTQTSADWQKLMNAYFSRQSIRYFLFLMDCRRELDETDMDLLEMLSDRGPVYFILTKADKLKTSPLQKQINTINEVLNNNEIPVERLIPVSSLKKKGIDKLRNLIQG